jgi:acyltransferase
MTSAKSVRYNWIDWSKSIAIFLVIWGHVPMQSETHTIIYSFHMPLFFLISGYLYNPKGTIKGSQDFAAPLSHLSIHILPVLVC